MSALIRKKVEIEIARTKKAMCNHKGGPLDESEEMMINDAAKHYRARLQLEENKRRAAAKKHAMTVDMFDVEASLGEKEQESGG